MHSARADDNFALVDNVHYANAAVVLANNEYASPPQIISNAQTHYSDLVTK